MEVFNIMPTSHENTELEELEHILREKSVRFGNFTLASGETSDVYVDCKLTTLSPSAMPLIGRAFLGILHQKGWSPEAVGGLTVGADPIAFAISREGLDKGKLINAFIVRKESEKHGMQRFIEGLETTAGRQVVIIDDVCTKGGSTAQAIEKAVEAGMRVLGAICLVDREMGATSLLQTRFGLTLASIFTLSDLRRRQDHSRVHDAA
jgi:orotate phosphoribosyltransferase